MNNHFVCIFFGILLFSCSSKNSNQENINTQISNSYISFSPDSLNIIWGNCSGEDAQCITLHLEYPNIIDAEDALKNYLNARIKFFFGEYLVMNEDVDYGVLTIEQMVDSAINNYKNLINISKNSSFKEPGWDYHLKADIDTFGNGYVTVTLSAYTFTGGAHGNHILKHFSFHHKQLVELKIDNVFTNTDSLLIIAEEEFRRMSDINPGVNYTDAGFDFPEDKFILTDNFALKAKGVVFYYNSYDIAPYSMGPTELYIPYKKLKNILNKDFFSLVIHNN